VEEDMPRPQKSRWINSWPGADFFKPRGIPLSSLRVVQLAVDEYEAMRLYDIEGLDQTEASERMKVSRPTFGRILTTAHRKVAEALVQGKAIQIGGGSFRTPAGFNFRGKPGRRGGGRRWWGGR
jgi:predicted DNA-binding protein (UPF0251 family)